MGRGPTKEYYKEINKNFIKGTLTCLRPEIIKSKINTEFPIILNIEPTNNCNARCYYCPRTMNAKAKKSSYLDFNDFKRIVNQASNNRLLMLNLHKDGEPLLHKELPSMVCYAKNKIPKTVLHLNTNGILINTTVGRGIIENGIDDITISVDAAKKATYLRLKKIKGLDILENNIKEVIEYRNKINGKTRIRVKIMEFDGIEKDEIEAFHEKWKGVADEIQVTGVHSWSGAIKNIAITDEQADKRYPCALLWYMLAINSNGEVSVCNVDWDYSGVVGNIHTQSIKDIWNGERIKKIRSAQLRGIWDSPQVCKECVVWVSVGNMWEYLDLRKEFI